MADVDMTMHATNIFLNPVYSNDKFVDEIGMTGETVFLQDTGVRALDHDGLMKILQREAFGMMPTVLGLGEVLAKEVVWQMAIHTVGNRVVTGLLPGVILRLHDVAIDADRWVVAHVREAFRVQEGIASHAEQDSDHYRQQARPSAQSAFASICAVGFCHRSPQLFRAVYAFMVATV